MRLLLLGSLFCGGAGFAGLLWAQPPTRFSAAVNVNSRYIVEGVEISGYSAAKLSDSLRDRLQAVVGQPYNTEILEALSHDLRRDLHAKAVTQHLAKGSNPESVRVVFDVTRRSMGLDISVPKFLYHSKQGWSGQVEGSTTIARNHNVVFGVVSDGDELTERFAGIYSRYENLHVGTDRVRFQFLFENFHQQWNRATNEAVANPALLTPEQRTVAPDIYRQRRNYQPVFTIVLAKPLMLTVGAGFQQMNDVIPDSRSETANAVILGLRYHKQYGTVEDTLHTTDMAYELRSATRILDSSYVYTRHHWAAGYTWSRGRHAITDVMTAGYITGRAPLYERFVVGTSSLLRGWNRFDIDPLGGNRLVHNSLEYRYRFAQVFYDAGSLWSHGKVPTLRHSIGIGGHYSIFTLAVAFPMRGGRVDPTFLVGMNY